MDGLIGFLIFGFVVYSIIKNAVGGASTRSTGNNGDFLANIDKIINTAYENTQRKSGGSGSSGVKKYKPNKPVKYAAAKHQTASSVAMNEQNTYEEDFSDLHTEDQDFASAVSIEEQVTDMNSSMESTVETATSLEFGEALSATESFSDSNVTKSDTTEELDDKALAGESAVNRLLGFDSNSLVKGFVFKEIFDRRNLL